MRSFVMLAALGLATPLAAQTFTDASGAHAGRSPHKVMRVAAQQPACAKTMHSQPAGKLPTYGLHAMPHACETISVAMTDAKSAERAE